MQLIRESKEIATTGQSAESKRMGFPDPTGTSTLQLLYLRLSDYHRGEGRRGVSSQRTRWGCLWHDAVFYCNRKVAH